ncbi:Ribonuclease kappa [Crotalus adamanteus]|uniref:Ribonuclease kappa n=1 Tax=Crotalus adamanteus TaxID=8729 RepID=A0AAW1AV71_CROAD
MLVLLGPFFNVPSAVLIEDIPATEEEFVSGVTKIHVLYDQVDFQMEKNGGLMHLQTVEMLPRGRFTDRVLRNHEIPDLCSRRQILVKRLAGSSIEEPCRVMTSVEMDCNICPPSPACFINCSLVEFALDTFYFFGTDTSKLFYEPSAVPAMGGAVEEQQSIMLHQSLNSHWGSPIGHSFDSLKFD